MIKLDYDHPIIMGILNVTPDSFSDGGQFQHIEVAVKHALKMIDEGADIIDVGGESTRPGSARVSADEQKKRVLAVIKMLSAKIPEKIFISIDTTLSEVAREALEAGASIINDVSAGRDDPGMFQLAAQEQCPCILMHMQGTPETMQANPVYDDVVEEIRSFLIERAETAINAGIKKENIILDPGIGFGKTREHNLELLANLHRFTDTGFPVVLGTSRKRFMDALTGGATPDQLTGATCATTALGVAAGVKLFRVHDVKENRQAADMTWAIVNRSA
jgi:dihydropteroate synthase